MSAIKAPCNRAFMPAFHSSGTRTLSLIHFVVVHDAEAPNAQSVAEYFRHHESGGSAHITVDDNECYRSLADETIPWGASSSFGANTHGFHIEQAGWSVWSSILWWRHRRQLNRLAYKTALHLHKFGLPCQFVGANGLLAGKRGVTTHKQITKASKKQDPRNAWRYTHTDPGFGWPRRRFMKRVRFYLDEIEGRGKVRGRA